jgi:hypothetical protein
MPTVKYPPEYRMVALLCMHHPSQRGRTFEARRARLQAFRELWIGRHDFVAEADGERVNVRLVTEAPTEVVLSPATLDLLISSITACADYVPDEMALAALEAELSEASELDSALDSVVPSSAG